jgi:dihydroorotate dehydrogenase
MITLSNGHSFTYMVASGALAFRGRGWWFERLFVWLGWIKPELFTIVTKTVTLNPIKGNLKQCSPWTCIRWLSGGGVVNKVGLTNKGFKWFMEKILPRILKDEGSVMVSFLGTKEELVTMTRDLNFYRGIVGVEINVSCPNTGHEMDESAYVVDCVKAVSEVCHLPIIVKVSVAQDYIAIAKGLAGVAQAISINSVPWHVAYPEDPDGENSPLQGLMRKLSHQKGDTGGGGGVSGKPAQKANWEAVKQIAFEVPNLPVIGPSIMEYEDLQKLFDLGASAYSFGAIHIRKRPWVPTQIVERHRAQIAQKLRGEGVKI